MKHFTSGLCRRLKHFGLSLFFLGSLLISCNSDSDQTNFKIDEDIFFDDFLYQNTADSELESFGWHARNGMGNPGPEGAFWSSDMISFKDGPTNKVLRLKAQIENQKLTQAELSYKEQKMFEGTYAARVYYTSDPDTGEDGARLVEAGFWLMGNYHETTGTEQYSECDFEYLPNGGWGFEEPVMHLTTWYNDVTRDNIHDTNIQEYSGWYTLLIVVANGHVKYYNGSELLADHSGKFYPRTNLSILSQLWFVDNVDKTLNSSYHIDIDWVFYQKGVVLSEDDVNSKISILRASEIGRINNLN